MLHIVGYRKDHKDWDDMRDIWYMCDKMKIPVPDLVLRYFNYERPTGSSPVEEISSDMYETFFENGLMVHVIDLEKVPKNVSHLKLYNKVK